MLRRPPQIVGNFALYYACYRLSELGWNVMPTSRNARGVDIICFSVDGSRMLTVQVKGLSKKTAVSLGNTLDKIIGDFWIIVTSIAAPEPNAYILLPHEVRAMAARAEKEGRVSHWLEHKRFAADEFKEAWHRIGSS